MRGRGESSISPSTTPARGTEGERGAEAKASSPPSPSHSQKREREDARGERGGGKGKGKEGRQQGLQQKPEALEAAVVTKWHQ